MCLGAFTDKIFCYLKVLSIKALNGVPEVSRFTHWPDEPKATPFAPTIGTWGGAWARHPRRFDPHQTALDLLRQPSPLAGTSNAPGSRCAPSVLS